MSPTMPPTLCAQILRGNSEVRLERLLKEHFPRRPSGLPEIKKVLLTAAATALGVLALVWLCQANMVAAPRPRPAAQVAESFALLGARPVKPIVPAELWHPLQIAQSAPEVLGGLSEDAVPFQYHGMLPSVRLDGVECGGKLPAALWLKLEQAGNAIVLVQTGAGTFVKVLGEVAPGYVSRCTLAGGAFGTLAGQPADLDPETKVEALWIIQDAAAPANHVPGWVALMPPAGDQSPVAGCQ